MTDKQIVNELRRVALHSRTCRFYLLPDDAWRVASKFINADVYYSTDDERRMFMLFLAEALS